MAKVGSLRVSTVRGWLANLKSIDGKRSLSHSTIHGCKSILALAFDLAIEDNLISSNPFKFDFRKLLSNYTEKKEGLTPKQTLDLLKFIKESGRFQRYYDAICILFNTGLRISGFAGLTASDIDFDGGMLYVNSQLLKHYNVNNYCWSSSQECQNFSIKNYRY